MIKKKAIRNFRSILNCLLYVETEIGDIRELLS